MGSAVSYYESLPECSQAIDFNSDIYQQDETNLNISIPKYSFQELATKKPLFDSQSPRAPKQFFQPTTSSKVFLKPIQYDFPAKASFVQIPQEGSQSQSIRRYKVSPRSTMKENTDQCPFEQENKRNQKKIKLPLIDLNEIPSLVIEQAPQSSITGNIPSINVNNNQNVHFPIQYSISEENSKVDETKQQVDSNSIDEIDANYLKRKKLDEYIYMKQCNASEEMFRLSQFKFPISNKLVMH